MAIPVYERRSQLNALPGARVQAPDNNGDMMAALALGGFAASLQEVNDRFEDAQVMEALNSFSREMSDYRHNPDKGIYNTRKGKNAFGISDDAERESDNLMFKYEKTMPSDRALNVYRRKAAELRDRYREADQKWQTRETETYRVEEAKAGIDIALKGIAAAYDNNDAVAGFTEDARMCMFQLTRDMGPDARKAAFDSLTSNIAEIRLGRIIEEDPEAAEEWYKKNKDSFTGDARAKAEKLLERETKAFKREKLRDDLIRRHGTNYAAARAEILKKYSGDEERNIMSLYSAWYNDEIRIQKSAQEAAEDKFFVKLNSFETESEALEYALKNAKTISQLRSAERDIEWKFHGKKKTQEGAYDKVSRDISNGKYDDVSLERFKREVAHLFTKEDFLDVKEEYNNRRREVAGDRKVSRRTADEVVNNKLSEISDVKTRESLRKAYDRQWRENPDMSSTEAIGFFNKIRAVESLESWFSALSNWRTPIKARVVEIHERQMKGERFNPDTGRWERILDERKWRDDERKWLEGINIEEGK